MRLSILVITALFLALSQATASGSPVTADECTPCTSSIAPKGYYSSAIGPAITAGARVWSPQSMVVLSASNLLNADSLRLLTSVAAQQGHPEITLSQLLAGKYIVMNLYLLAKASSSPTPDSVKLLTPAGVPPPALLTIQPAPGWQAVFSGIYVFARAAVLAPNTPWLRVQATSGHNRVTFSMKSYKEEPSASE